MCLLNVRNRNYFPMTLSQQLNVIPTINPNDGRNTPTKQKLLLPSIFVLFFLSFFCFLYFLSKSPGCVITIFFISSCLIYSFLCKLIIQLFYFLNPVPLYRVCCFDLCYTHFILLFLYQARILAENW